MNHNYYSKSVLVLFLFVFLILFYSCGKEKVKKEYKPNNAHEQYIYALEKANLQKSVLYKQFVKLSEDALIKPFEITIPYSEIFYIDHANPNAFGYKFELKRGQKITISTELLSSDSIKLFLDVFRIRDSANTSRYKVASSDSFKIEFTARRNANYVLRIQPELLCDVRCKVKIHKESSLLFPVMGKNRSAIQSFFGDPRDGGTRRHHGVDIFAKKHTDIIASADGYVGRSVNRGIGGRHVWIFYPSLRVRCYYAHLESVDIITGKKIKAGTKIGTVGNTGNARYTPPHLHFGIYQSGIGPVDPYYFIATPDKKPEKVSVQIDLLEDFVRTNSNHVNFYSNGTISELSKYTSLNVLALTNNKVRVETPDGTKGFVNIKNVEVCSKPIETKINSQIVNVFNKPSKGSLLINELITNEEFGIYSLYGDFGLVKLKNGKMGWINTSEII